MEQITKVVLVKACESCGAFVAEVLTPIGDGAADHCWLCAHAYGVHEATTPHEALAELAACSCAASDIYPPDVRARTLAKLEDANSGARAEPLYPLMGEFRTLSEAEVKEREAGYRGPIAVMKRPGFARSVRVARVIRKARETWEDDRTLGVPRLHRSGENAGKSVTADSE